jgi:hypothetical protein
VLPRYVPNIGWRSWRDWLFASGHDAGDSWPRFLESLGMAEPPLFHREFDTLRTGLLQYFSDVCRRVGGGSILVSAQICRAVPLAIERAGLSVRYVDVASDYPTPSAAQFIAALDQTTLGVLVAPLYGHIQRDWSALLTALNGRILVLDMAQGLGLTARIGPLVRRADAVAYSFGLGKGLDAGGGLLLTRTALEAPSLPRRSKAMLAGPLLKSIALHVLVRMGCYGLVVSRLDSMDATDQTVPETGMSVPPDMCRFWQARLPTLLSEIALARKRAGVLAMAPSVVENLRDATVCFDAEASHLRQLIRIRDATRRDALISRLRSLGVDCAPAGEPLPDIASAAQRFPHAAAFRADAVRLPFLGRLTGLQFDAFMTILERAVADCLH